MEIAKAYTNTLEILNQCNYIFSDTTNARDALLSCINQPNQENPIDDNLCLNSSDVSNKIYTHFKSKNTV